MIVLMLGMQAIIAFALWMEAPNYHTFGRAFWWPIDAVKALLLGLFDALFGGWSS